MPLSKEQVIERILAALESYQAMDKATVALSVKATISEIVALDTSSDISDDVFFSLSGRADVNSLLGHTTPLRLMGLA